MTVAELIAQLKDYAPGADVYFAGDETDRLVTGAGSDGETVYLS